MFNKIVKLMIAKNSKDTADNYNKVTKIILIKIIIHKL